MRGNSMTTQEIERYYKPAKVDGKTYHRVLFFDEEGYPDKFSALKRLEEVIEFAKENGLFDQFKDRVLEHFQHYNGYEHRVLLNKDFAPYSFGFSLYMQNREDPDKWDFWFNGGVIFHGPHDNGGDGGPPTYSVSLNPTIGWSIHT